MTASQTGESAPAVTDPADLGVLDAAAALREHRLSSVELTEACLRTIERVNGGPPSFDGRPDAINAWVRLYPERALDAARAADERRAREGEDAPLLCGIPIGLKDLYGVAGLPLTASSRVLEGNVATADATAWSRLAAEGMVLIGHTHTHEFAAGGTTDQVGNPWSLERVAGGSSGGSAAALAARMVPAALGSDTCGSLRIPSACCGTSAVKPTHGLLALDGIIPLAPSLDHPGPMGRTIADCAALLTGLLRDGPPASAVSPPPASPGPLPVAATASSRPLAGLTIAVTDRTDLMVMDAEIAIALGTARRACEHLGARVVSAPAPWALDWDDLSTVLFTDTWAYHARYADRADRYRPAIAEFLEAGRAFTAAAPYLAAQRRRDEGTAAWERWFAEGGIDLVLEPTLPIVPYGRGPGYDRGHAGGAGDPMIALTATWDMTGMPVAALPVTWEANVSLIAPRGREATLLQAAIDLQTHELGVPRWSAPERIDDATTDGWERT
jgi:aspartyl-tRNA(Asn)/glutamyl-tRNA(Gln) amidotransferase subunit A